MRAVRIDRLGDSFDRVEVVDVERPQPGPGEVLVRMRLAPINPSDLHRIHGTYHRALEQVIWNQGAGPDLSFDPDRAHPCPQPPYTLGGEGVGMVEASGGGILARRLKGKRVAVAAGAHGTWAEHTVVDAKRAIVVPPRLSDEQASMLLVNPLSAVIMVLEELRPAPGSWLLQSAAGSALGKSVVRLGKRYGFRTINVVRSDANRNRLEALGADEIIATDRQDIVAEVARITGGRGVAYAIDCVGGATAEALVASLGLGGRLLLYGTMSPEPMVLPSRRVMMPTSTVQGLFVPNWMRQRSLLRRLGIVRKLRKLAAAGIFETEVHGTVPVDDVRSALETATARGRTGKVLLRLS